jgi:hypothetical protein
MPVYVGDAPFASAIVVVVVYVPVPELKLTTETCPLVPVFAT